MISRGEHKINTTKMKAIIKWPTQTNVTEVRSFVGATQYLQMLLESSTAMATPLHAITTRKNSFQFGKNP